ncbi:MAG: DsrE family protein [Armatimonadetes bacterium]|nr:DsrE family protein [Armatimonadota bacterium]
MASIGFIVSRAPLDGPGSRTFYHLAIAALEGGIKVDAYCHQDGVYQALKGQYLPDRESGSPSSWWRALLARGARVVASELCARSRGIEPSALLEGVSLGSTLELSAMLERCERVVCL